MTNRIDVLALFEEGNPVPPDALQAPVEPPVEYLGKLTLEPQPTRTPSRRTGRWLAAAAAVVVLIGIVFAITSLVDSEPPVVTNPPTPTSTSIGPTTTLDDNDAAWEAIPEWNLAEDSGGVFRSSIFTPDVTLAVPEFWTRFPGGELPIGLRPMVPVDDPEVGGLFVYRHEGETVESFVEFIQAHPAVNVVTVHETTIGGAHGTQIRFDVTLPMTYIQLNESSAHTLGSGTSGMTHVVDVGGETVSVFIFGRQADSLDTLIDQAQPVIDSIDWRNFP